MTVRVGTVACVAGVIAFTAPALVLGQGSNLGSYGQQFVPGTIAGKVTAGGAPVAGARVETSAGHFTTTDASGDYTLNVEAGGLYDVSASSGSGTAGPVQVSVTMGSTTTRDFDLCTQPTIGKQPTGKSIGSGETAALSVLGAGSPPLTYQWYQGASGNTAQSLAGATAASFTTPALTATSQFWVRVTNGCGHADSVTATITVLSGNARRFDFGTTTSPVATGYLRVAHTTTFTAARGYGWTSGVIQSRDRGTGGDLRRDFDFTPLGTFEVAVANGSYDVAFVMGDASAAHDQMGVYLEGTLFASVSLAANEYATPAFRVTVADGRLTVLLDDLGGSDPNVVIDALVVVGASPRRLDFGAAASPVQAGYTRVSETSTYSSSRGHGWLSGTVGSRDRSGANALTRDFNFTALATFAMDLAPGLYSVGVTMGDAAARHDEMGVFIEGSQVDTVTTNAGQFLTRSYRVRVLDGQLTLLLDDLGGSDPNVVINALDVSRLGPFDFGTATSAVAAGYTQVTGATAYGAGLGYGWSAGTVGSRDRATGEAIRRDFCFSGDATFAVDVPNGAYAVSVVMGDAIAKHDLMGVLLEGAQADAVTSNAGQYQVRTFSVTVSDSTLNVRFKDLGGSDGNAVINALSLVPLAP